MSGDPRFHVLLKEIGLLHDRKSTDYACDEDAFANFRRSERFGIEAWKLVLARMGDKWARIENYALKGELVNESFEDALLDNAVYSLIALILWRETQQQHVELPEEETAAEEFREAGAEVHYIYDGIGAVPLPNDIHERLAETLPDVQFSCGCYQMPDEGDTCSQHGAGV